jgi:hypothetical protein
MNIVDAGVRERGRAVARTELCNTRQGMGLFGLQYFSYCFDNIWKIKYFFYLLTPSYQLVFHCKGHWDHDINVGH